MTPRKTPATCAKHPWTRFRDNGRDHLADAEAKLVLLSTNANAKRIAADAVLAAIAFADAHNMAERSGHASGNVFADLGFAKPDTELVKADLVHAITTVIEQRDITQVEAADRMGIKQPNVSLLLRGRTESRRSDTHERRNPGVATSSRIVSRPLAQATRNALVARIFNSDRFPTCTECTHVIHTQSHVTPVVRLMTASLSITHECSRADA